MMTDSSIATEAESPSSDNSAIDAVLQRYPEVAAMVNAVYTLRGVRLFLTTPMRRFDNRTALELMNDGEVERVVSALAADQEWLSSRC